MMKLIFTLFLLLPAVAQAEKYEIYISHFSLPEMNEVKNCIDYNFCEVATSFIERSYTASSSMAIQVDLNLTDRDRLLKECVAPYQYRFRISVTDELRNKIAIPYASNEFNSAGTDAPVRLKERPRDENQRIQFEIEKRVQKKKYLEAIEFASAAYEIDFQDYQVFIGSKKGGEFAVTDHELKTVTIGPDFFKSACDLVLGMRHEAEHITQVKRRDACGGRNALDEPLYRERSAHLNDLLNIRTYCSDFSFINGEIKFRMDRLFSKYGNISL